MSEQVNIQDYLDTPVHIKRVGVKRYNDGRAYAYVIFSTISKPDDDLVAFVPEWTGRGRGNNASTD